MSKGENSKIDQMVQRLDSQLKQHDLATHELLGKAHRKLIGMSRGLTNDTIEGRDLIDKFLYARRLINDVLILKTVTVDEFHKLHASDYSEDELKTIAATIPDTDTPARTLHTLAKFSAESSGGVVSGPIYFVETENIRSILAPLECQFETHDEAMLELLLSAYLALKNLLQDTAGSDTVFIRSIMLSIAKVFACRRSTLDTCDNAHGGLDEIVDIVCMFRRGRMKYPPIPIMVRQPSDKRSLAWQLGMGHPLTEEERDYERAATKAFWVN